MITPEKLQEYRDYAEWAGSDISIYSIEYQLAVMVWNLCDEVERFGAVQEYAHYYCMAWHAHLAGDVAPMTFNEWCADAAREAEEERQKAAEREAEYQRERDAEERRAEHVDHIMDNLWHM